MFRYSQYNLNHDTEMFCNAKNVQCVRKFVVIAIGVSYTLSVFAQLIL